VARAHRTAQRKTRGKRDGWYVIEKAETPEEQTQNNTARELEVRKILPPGQLAMFIMNHGLVCIAHYQPKPSRYQCL
jgi:hypothetical protein